MNLITKTLATALALAFTPLAQAGGPDWTATDWFASGLGAINPGTAGVPSPGAAFQEASIEGDGLVIMGDGTVVSGAGIHVYNDHGDGAWKVTTAGAPVPVVLNGTPQFEGTFGVFVGTRQVGQLNGASAFTLVYSTPRAATVPDAFGRTGIQNMTFDAACNVVFPDPCTNAVKAQCASAGLLPCSAGSATCGGPIDPCTHAVRAQCVASGFKACSAGSADCDTNVGGADDA